MSILEMKVPSPGESITEVEIATWLVKDGDYVEKDQAIAEVDSDKATLELPAEESGIITLKAEEGEVVKVGQVVCLIDRSASKPAGETAAPSPVKEEPENMGAWTYMLRNFRNQNIQVISPVSSGTPAPGTHKKFDKNQKGVINGVFGIIAEDAKLIKPVTTIND